MKKFYFLPIALLFLGAGAIRAQYTDLHDFNGTLGSEPEGNLTLYKATLYGMSSSGGANGIGCVFSVDTNGNNYKDLLDFDESNGEQPLGSLSLLGGILYGMTELGGTGNGNIFSVDTTGSNYTNVFDFGGTNGEEPNGSITFSGNVLYGMTPYGGANSDGCIFTYNSSGYTDLFDFNGTDGKYPSRDLILYGNLLFGMTKEGGANGDGCVFSIDTMGMGYTDLLDFDGTNGESPLGSLTLKGTKLFGMTQAGGANSDGCVFTIDTNGHNYKDLLDFDGANGETPMGSLILSATGDTLYGMTELGGAKLDGNVFMIDTAGNGYTDLLDFNNANGQYPEGSLTLPNTGGNTLFGMTSIGGAKSDGVIFKLDTIVTVTTSINKSTQNKEGINIYPNPNNGKFTLVIVIASVAKQSHTNIEIYNTLGQQIYSQFNIQNPTFNIDLSSQPSGVYLYRVIANSGELIGEGKVVIQK